MSAEPQLSDAPEPHPAAGDELLDELTAEVPTTDRAPKTEPAKRAPVRPTVRRTRPTLSPETAEMLLGRTELPDAPPDAPVPRAVPTPAISPPGVEASRRTRRREARLKARQVRRVVRRVDVWSVLKVAAIFWFCLWLILVVAGTILWRVAVSAGAIDNVEKFIAELLAEKTFTIDGAQVLRASAIGGVILVFAGTAFTVLLAILFNLISQFTGGVRFTVIELETATPVSTADSDDKPRRFRRRAR